MYNLAQTGQLPKQKRVGYARKYFKKRLKAINEILHLEPKNFTQESIHELRLEIKKMKALFSVIRYSNNNFRVNKYFKPFKTIFKKAGGIRIIQVEQELLKKYIPDASDSYLSQLQKFKEEKGKALEKLFKSDIIAKLKSTKNKIIPFLDTVSEKNVKKFLKRNTKKIAESVERKIFKEQNLHVIRKELKSFYFIAKTTNAKMTITEPWNRLQELLGQWHDDQVAIEHLRKALYSSQFNQDEINRLHTVKRELVENKENLFDQIVATSILIENKEGTITIPDNAKASISSQAG